MQLKRGLSGQLIQKKMLDISMQLIWITAINAPNQAQKKLKDELNIRYLNSKVKAIKWHVCKQQTRL